MPFAPIQRAGSLSFGGDQNCVPCCRISGTDLSIGIRKCRHSQNISACCGMTVRPWRFTLGSGGFGIDRLGQDVIRLLDHLGSRPFLLWFVVGAGRPWMGLNAAKRVGNWCCAYSAHIGPPTEWNARIDSVNKGGILPISTGILDAGSLRHLRA